MTLPDVSLSFEQDGQSVRLAAPVSSLVQQIVTRFHADVDCSGGLSTLCTLIDQMGETFRPTEIKNDGRGLAPRYLQVAITANSSILPAAIRAGLPVGYTQLARVKRLNYLWAVASVSCEFKPYWLRADEHQLVIVRHVPGYYYEGTLGKWFGPFSSLDDFFPLLERQGWLVDSAQWGNMAELIDVLDESALKDAKHMKRIVGKATDALHQYYVSGGKPFLRSAG